MKAPLHPREAERLEAVRETNLLGGSIDSLQQSVVKLASQLCGTPISAVSLIDVDRQWFSAICGLDCRETSRELAFCAHTILGEMPLIVSDAAKDARFVDNALVTGQPHIRFYAGVPLMTASGLPLGSLCVIDSVPRALTSEQIENLRTLGSLVATQLEMHRRNTQLQAQKASARELFDRLTKIASRVPGVIYQFRQHADGTSCFPYASEGIRQVYRVTPEQVREDASAVFAILHPDDLQTISESIHESARRLTPWKLEYRVRFPDGVERWLLGDASPEREADGSTLWHGFITDITERMQTQAAVRKAQRAAEAASKAKSEFLANMSHEIRTPLTAILGFTDLLREQDSVPLAPEQRTAAINTIKNAGEHLLSVINDILDLSKIEADKMTVERVDTQLIQTLREIESLMRPRAVGKGVALSIRLRSPVPERILSDPTRLRQILMNLVGNAIKFTDAGSVSISAYATDTEGGQKLIIDIDDTGSGMTPEQVGRLFVPFGQADSTVTRKHGGTGLGLTISHRLASMMGGDVTLTRTAPGKGSSFRLMLPLEAAPATAMVDSLDAVAHAVAHAAAQAAAPAAPRLSGRILLAEDGADNQRLIGFHLKKAGATVDIAPNGHIALEMIADAEARGVPYDMLLTDMQMPEIDGYTLARTLRQRGSTLAIVALTAHAMAEDAAKCIDAGCDDYTTKPIEKAELARVCAAWMGKKGGAKSVARAA